MTSTKATEFLTKQIHIQKEIVTFRWLSRELSVHVNVAKNELASFYASSLATDEPVHATYLLIGNVLPVKATGSYRADEDEIEVDDNVLDLVATSKIVLVGENELESAKAQFIGTPSIHIYSLSPSIIRDAALLAPMADRVRSDDKSKGKVFNQSTGIVVGSDVKVGTASKSSSSNLIKATTSTSNLHTPVLAKKTTEQPRDSDKGKAPIKQEDKKKGTLDWSKAKSKADKEKEATAKKAKEAGPKPSSKQKETVSRPEAKKEKESRANVKMKESVEKKKSTGTPANAEKPRRGTKRPSNVMSLSDSENDDPPKTKPRISASPHSGAPSRANGVQVKKGVLLSDDDEEVSTKEVKLQRTKQKGKGRAAVTDDEDEDGPSLRAMMDLDDSEVIRHNKPSTSTSAPQSDQEDVEMLSDSEPIPARPKVKRKPKKVIPVGRNGLPKKRVMKSRKSKNAKGYTVTEDYSSYESVSESEQVQAPIDAKKKKQGKKAKIEEGVVSVSANSGASGIKSTMKLNKDADSPAKVKEEAVTESSKPETKKPQSGSGGGSSKSTPVARPGSGGKNLMSYFGKK